MTVSEQNNRKQIEMHGFCSVKTEQEALNLISLLNDFFNDGIMHTGGLNYVSSIRSFGLGYIVFQEAAKEVIQAALLQELEQHQQRVYEIKYDLKRIKNNEVENVT